MMTREAGGEDTETGAERPGEEGKKCRDAGEGRERAGTQKNDRMAFTA